jgi:hypothetical protein
LEVSRRKKLVGRELKSVAKDVLEALRILHEDGYVHTGQSNSFIGLEYSLKY